MSLRAFIIGLICVAALCLADPYMFHKGWGLLTVGHFPPGAILFLVVLTLGLNVLIKLVRRTWGLRQPELMLIWCMLTVAAVLPSDGLQRWWLPVLAGPAYVSGRSDIVWRDTSLAEAPDSLLLTKDHRSAAAKQFFEGRPEGAQIPWGLWLRPISRWAVFILLFYMATMFLCALLRRQWVEAERLQFPLARVPLEFTEGSDGPGRLPAVFRDRAFVKGLIAIAALRLVRALPLLFGSASRWALHVPFKTVLTGTPLEHLYLEDFEFWFIPLGFAYLVPADVSLSVWFFYLFGSAELQAASWLGSPLHYGGHYSALLSWQMAGAYMAFTVGALYTARRHFARVLAKAVGRARDADDSDEPVRYAVAFWGLVVCLVGAAAWFVCYGMRAWVAVLMMGTLMCIMLVHARMVAQSGLYVTLPMWAAPDVLQGLAFGHLFGAKGAVVAQMQHGIMINSNFSLLSPAAINAFRIADVFEQHRRKLLAVLVAALVVGLVASSWSYLTHAYTEGALNFTKYWGPRGNPEQVFRVAHQRITRPTQLQQGRFTPFLLGIGLTGAVMFMRARFYWWPIHSIGLLANGGWFADRIWLPFLVGWLVKVSLMKFGSGRLLRGARSFFIAVILAESFLDAVSAVVRAATGGSMPAF
ncbi:MAG: hypothetical protein AMK73_00935 [Planctomycetes bacterium SM23_32]|nr:MAG: hypothetical protein AMK73_00935 [Planctomycetes bacterium SM23_32]